MARNRKYQSAAIRFGPAIKAFLLCAVIGGSGLGYVWQKSQIDQLGRQILKREQELKALDLQNEKLRKGLAWMHSMTWLEEQIKTMNFGLVQPQQTHIWRLRVPRTEAADPVREPVNPRQARIQELTLR